MYFVQVDLIKALMVKLMKHTGKKWKFIDQFFYLTDNSWGFGNKNMGFLKKGN